MSKGFGEGDEEDYKRGYHIGCEEGCEENYKVGRANMEVPHEEVQVGVEDTAPLEIEVNA